MRLPAILMALLICWVTRAVPQESPAWSLPTDQEDEVGMVSITLTDGTTLTGRIVDEAEDSITVLTPANLTATIPRTSIVAVAPVRGRMVEGVYRRFDPNYSRHMFAPTGRPLREGDGYISNYYVFFPGVSYGFTDRLSIAAGLSVFPGASLDQQILSVSPRYGLYVSDELAVSVGTLYMTVPEEGSAGIAFAAGSVGPPDRCLTAGLGLGYVREQGEDVDFTDGPIILVGGNVRLSNSVALVSESWFIIGEGLGLDEQPLGIVVRFFGERLAVDVGTIIIGEVVKEGFPIPWLSFVYHFDK